MYDIVELKNRKPIHAVGHPCIMLTDPITGKVVDKVEGDNHVFLDALFTNTNWVNNITSNFLCLNDSSLAIDPTLPYLFGQTLGYGRYNVGSSGAFRGAYNATNSVIAKKNTNSLYWKFQYDFTPAQANGTIQSVGLTSQYSSTCRVPAISYPIANDVDTHGSRTNDGKFTYNCSTVGIISKYNIYEGTTSTIDISAIVGTATQTKNVAYNPSTQHYYIYNTVAKTLYEFSDSTFATYITSYSLSNIGSTNINGYPTYIYGNIMYFFCAVTNALYYVNYVANTAMQTLSCTAYNNASYTENTNSSNGIFVCGSCPLTDKYILTGLLNTGSLFQKGFIFDLSTCTVVGHILNAGINNDSACYKYPVITENLICSSVGATNAIAAKKLDAPITKTSANGLTAIYELEVFW